MEKVYFFGLELIIIISKRANFLPLEMVTRTCTLKPLDHAHLSGLALTRSAEGVEIGDIGQSFPVDSSPGIGDRILSVNNIDVKSSGVLSVLRLLQSEAKKGNVQLGVSGQKQSCRRSSSMRSTVSAKRNQQQQLVLHGNPTRPNSFSAYGMKIVFDPEVGNVVWGVVQNSISAKAGIRMGDTIVQINHEIVMNYPFEKFRNIIETMPVDSIKLYVATRRRLLERIYRGLPILTQYEPDYRLKRNISRSTGLVPQSPSRKSDRRKFADPVSSSRSPQTKYTYTKVTQESDGNPISNNMGGWIEYHTISKRTRGQENPNSSSDQSWIKSLSMNDLTDNMFKAKNIDLTVWELEQNQCGFASGDTARGLHVISKQHFAKRNSSESEFADQSHSFHSNKQQITVSAGNRNSTPNTLTPESTNEENMKMAKRGLSKQTTLSNNDDEQIDSIMSEQPEVIYRIPTSQADDNSLSDSSAVNGQTLNQMDDSNEFESVRSTKSKIGDEDYPVILNITQEFPSDQASFCSEKIERMRSEVQTILEVDQLQITQSENDEISSRTNKSAAEKTSSDTFMGKVDVENLWDPENIQKMRGEAKLVYAKIRAPNKNTSLGLVLKSISANNGKLKALHLVDRISPGLPAHEANVEEGDIIMSVNGLNAEEMNHSEIISTISKNKTDLTFGIKRIFLDGDSGNGLNDLQRNGDPRVEDDDEVSITIKIDDQSSSVGIKLDTQLMVASVDPNSPAHRAGLKIGDRIIEINEEPLFLHDYKVSFGILKEAQASKLIRMKVLRPKVASKPTNESGGEIVSSWKNGSVHNYVIGDISESEKIGIKLKECRQPPHLILEVDEDSASYRAGVKPNSYVIGVNGMNVVNATFKNLMDYILQHKKAGELILHVMDGRTAVDDSEGKTPNTECSTVDYS